MFTFSVTIILYEALWGMKSKWFQEGIVTLAWWYALSDSLPFSKNFKEKHICGALCICRDQGFTSTQVEHQPASDKKEGIAVCRLLKVQLSCSEEFAESAGPYRDQGGLC